MYVDALVHGNHAIPNTCKIAINEHNVYIT